MPQGAEGDCPRDNQESQKAKNRAAFYFDGFNFYHAVDALGDAYLKWVNLWALGERLISRSNDVLVRVVYCTAKRHDLPGKQKRHQEYISALAYHGVDVLLGHFKFIDVDCHNCGYEWESPSEKESDVNLAIELIKDAHADKFDHAYLVTADSDQAPTARMIKNIFPNKQLVSVIPPGQIFSKAILTHTNRKLEIRREHIEDCLLDGIVVGKVGGKDALIYRRPTEYAPPPGFVRPSDQRQAKGK